VSGNPEKNDDRSYCQAACGSTIKCSPKKTREQSTIAYQILLKSTCFSIFLETISSVLLHFSSGSESSLAKAKQIIGLIKMITHSNWMIVTTGFKIKQQETSVKAKSV
jgi:hypothetical protein